MAKIYKQKMTVEMEGEFVVFFIGMRLNKPWKIHKWWPVFRAMPRMLKELSADPESGLLGYRLVSNSHYGTDVLAIVEAKQSRE